MSRIVKFGRLALTAGLLAMAVTGCGGRGNKKTTPTIGQRVPILSRIESGAEVDRALANVAIVLPPERRNAE